MADSSVERFEQPHSRALGSSGSLNDVLGQEKVQRAFLSWRLTPQD